MTDEKTRRAKYKLQESKSKLDTLLTITNAINNNASKQELFNILTPVLTKELNIAKFALFTYNSRVWEVSLYQGIGKEVCDGIDVNRLIEKYLDIGIITENATNDCINQFDIVIPVFHKDQAVAYMILADFEIEKFEISPIIKHLRFIQTLINIIVVALENKRLTKEHINQIAVKKELELAQNMQSLLFPRALPNNKNIHIKAVYLPHSEVGGDYYDIIQMDENRLAICIADVSGKGISAALLMANFQANIRALVSVSDQIEDIVEKCNQKVIESANYQKFITLFLGIFNAKDKTLTYINSGHQPPVLFQQNKARFLTEGSTVLGMFDELPELKSESIQLGKNSVLVCYTDGLTELEDGKGNQLEAEGVKKLLIKEKGLESINNTLKSKISELQNQSGADDDITFLAAEFFR